MKAVLFSDPNCPFCYATEERLHRLGLADRVQWRGVQHAPELPVPTGPSPHAGTALRNEVESIRQLAPEVPIAVPPAKPNTGPAILVAAAALRFDPAAGRNFVRSLYSSFWREGVDLADQEKLTGLAGGAGLAGLTVTEVDRETARGWRRDWIELGAFGVPLMLRADGQPLSGLTDSARLAAFLSA